MIYIYNALSILVLGMILNNKLEVPKVKRKYLFFCFCQMALIQGLRDISVGKDTNMYVNVYKGYLINEFYAFQFTHFEWGFKLLYNICHNFDLSSQQVLLIISFIMMFGFSYFIYINSKNICLSTFIFACMFFPSSLNIMRQYLAAAIAINSFQYIIQNKYIKAGILIFLRFIVSFYCLNYDNTDAIKFD